MDAQDHELLARFQTQRDESAFHRLVDRHIGMVYAVAKRVTDNSALAEEVAQSTFVKLADKSVGITRETALAGWLYQTSRRLALSTVRSDARRRQREQIAATMNLNEPGPRVVAEHLESAMDQLSDADRDALVLRFLEDRSLREVGRELGLAEDAARMRVNRALEKLRGVFGKLGITGSAAWLGATLTTGATASVPAGLGTAITTAVLGGTAVAAATTALVTQTTTTTMNLFNLKTAAALLGAAAVTGTTTYLVKESEAEQLRADYQTVNETYGKLAAEQQEARALIQLRDEQIERLRRDVADLPRLRGEVDRLNRQLQAMEQLQAENVRLAGLVAKLEQRLLDVASNPVEQQRLQDEVRFRAVRIGHVNNLKFLALAMRIYANDHQDAFPDALDNPGFLATLSGLASSGTHVAEDYDPNDYEQVYFGGDPSVLDPNIVTIRQREPFVDQNGNKWKTYALADGSVQCISEDKVGSFEQFERNWTQSRQPIQFQFVLVPGR